jgi:hypothetical protein
MTEAPSTFDWRALLKVHPAAEAFEPLPEAEMQELTEDIRVNGLRALPVLWWSADQVPFLIDGRTRLDALAQLGLIYETPDHHVGLRTWTGTKWANLSGDRMLFENVRGDPYEIARSFNVRRRHLSFDDKRRAVERLLKIHPELSHRQIAEKADVSPTSVGKIYKQKQEAGDVSTVDTSRIDTKGRRQPTHKHRAPKQEVAAAERDTLAATAPTLVHFTFHQWLKLFRSGWKAVRPSGYGDWTRKQRNDACEIINQVVDEALAKIRAVDRDSDDDAAGSPLVPETKDPEDLVRQQVHAAKQARQQKMIDRKVRGAASHR